MKVINLHEIPRESKIIFPHPMEVSDGSTFITFHHLDGLYSYCTSEKGNVMHLSVMTPLYKNDDGSYTFAKDAKEETK